MVSEDFYKRYQRYLSWSPLFSMYIKWVYKKTHKDIINNGLKPAYNNVLLCGTCGEKTSSLFVKHILSYNPNANITILDYGEAQIKHSMKYIEEHLPDVNVSYIVADAKQSGLPSNTFDYIDTDYMFEYFSHQGLDVLLKEWRRLLTSDGIASFRAFAITGGISKLFYWLIVDCYCQFLLKSKTYSYTLKNITEFLRVNNYWYIIAGKALFPFGYRFVTTKN